ncbi:NAD(P)/FAD-dependent oxidoreductase [Lysinibacillus telephonicus]|uniref:Ferredoxin--NADP reductase n=1 Tax=Lysinibacillus telephonicus TaxID=1714840 RepID=A0A431URQ1_9BACI|nr:NAD(P)/FAD-dependent oxidoreductase [Lysinibacillus telephonicus]RTQ93002.1 NAD(P)/FAD-dependent oxidoreductase [Lysinibacillus telephonicus]
MNTIYDVTIIGGGPSGLFSAFYAGLRDMKTKIIESQPMLGGKVHVYPEKLIWDIGGMTPITGQQLIDQSISQALTFDPTVCVNTKVRTIGKEDNMFIITTESGEKHFSKTVILAIGSGIVNHQKLEIEGAEKFENTNLFYSVRSLYDFKDKSILISGGGHAAIDWAHDLHGFAKDITVIYRGEKLSGHEAYIQKIKNNGTPILLNTQIKQFVPSLNGSTIQQVILENTTTTEEKAIHVDAVLINHGFLKERTIAFDDSITVERDKERNYKVVTNGKCETSVPGLFAAGDIAEYPSKIHLIAGAYQDALHAVNSAKAYLDPTANPTARVSSHNETFDERNREIFESRIKEKTTIK